MKDIKTTMFIVVSPKGEGILHTLSALRRDCLHEFTKYWTKSKWKDFRKEGWQCKKVDVTITSVENYIGLNNKF